MNKYVNRILDKLRFLKAKENDIHEKEKNFWFMPKTVILDELQVRRYVIFTSSIICALLFILLLWATFASVDEVAVTYGEVVTATKVSQIQHLEGGILNHIYVEEGQEVKKDQLLATLDDTAAKAELEELQAREASLTADIDRLRAFVNGKSTEQTRVNPNNFDLTKSDTTSVKDIVEGDKAQLSLESKSQKNQQAILQAQIEQQQDEIEKLTGQLAIIEKNKIILSEEFSIYKKLAQKEYVSKMAYLMKQRDVNQLESDRTNLIFELNKAKNSLKEYQAKLTELNTSLDKDAVSSLNKSTDELVQVQYALNKLRDRVVRSKIYSPINGVVKGIEVVSGSVVAPSGVLMTIVPSHQMLRVETRITTLDIGHVHVGDPARVKVLTYDYARYGNIDGKLAEISATTFFDEASKTSYYKGIIQLKDQYVKNKSNQLRAGMTVQADVVTGSKTVLQYLVKPIYANVQSAFHER